MDFSKITPYLLKALPYVVVLVIGIAIGWQVKPGVVEIKEKVVEVAVEKKVIDEDLVATEVAKRVKEIESKMDVKVVTRWIEKPDGTKEVTKTEETKTETKETEVKVVEKIVTVEKEVIVEKKVEVEKIVEQKPVLPQWMAGIGVGVAPRFDNPGSTPIMLQVDVRRRILGPFFMGVQVQAGTPVTGFNVTNSALFVTGAMEF